MNKLVGYDTQNVNGIVRVLDDNVGKFAFSEKDTYRVETEDDATVSYEDGTVAVSNGSTAIIDVQMKNGKLFAWSVRDEELGHNLAVGSLHTPGWFRAFCKKRGAKVKYVKGGCSPINPDGFTCVDCFNMSGTEFYLVPDGVITEFMRDNEEFKKNSYWH